MADIASYSELIAAIQSMAEDDGTEFTNYIPTAISLAEQRMNRELDLPDLEGEMTGTLSPTIDTLPKPSGYRYANYLHILIGTKKVQLKKRREDYLHDYWPDPTITAPPKYYSDTSPTNFFIVPTPDLSYNFEIRYTTEPIRLGPTNTTNYFTDRCVDILYLASMVEMALFMKAWQQVPIWEDGYTKLKDGWNLTMSRFRKDDGSSPMHPSPSLNTIKHTSKTNA